MPTKLPRLYVTIPQELHDALAEFNAETGIAKSQLVSQLLAETTPVVKAMTESFRLAKKSPAAGVARIRELAQEAHIGIAQFQLDIAPQPKKKKLRRSPRR